MPVKRQKVDVRSLLFERDPALDINLIPVVARKTISEVERDYRSTAVFLMMIGVYRLMTQPILLTTYLMYLGRRRFERVLL